MKPPGGEAVIGVIVDREIRNLHIVAGSVIQLNAQAARRIGEPEGVLGIVTEKGEWGVLVRLSGEHEQRKLLWSEIEWIGDGMIFPDSGEQTGA